MRRAFLSGMCFSKNGFRDSKPLNQSNGLLEPAVVYFSSQYSGSARRSCSALLIGVVAPRFWLCLDKLERSGVRCGFLSFKILNNTSSALAEIGVRDLISTKGT